MAGVNAVVILLLLALILGQSLHEKIGLYDEGFALTNAWRAAGGEIPHQDYWTAYPPGLTLVLAAVFKITGPSLLASRVVNALWGLGFLLSFHQLIRIFDASQWRIVWTVQVAGWYLTAFYPAYSALPALAVLFASLAAFARALAGGDRRLAGVAGAVGGLSMVFRHDFFAYLAASWLMAWLSILAFRKRSDRSQILALTQRYGIALCGVGALALSAILIISGWRNFLEQAILFPAFGMRAHRLLPVPEFSEVFSAPKILWLMAWVVPIVLALAAVRALSVLRQADSTRFLLLIMTATLALLLTLQSRNRLDWPHFAPSLILTTAFLATLLSGGQSGRVHWADRWLKAAALVLPLGLSLPMFWRQAEALDDLRCLSVVFADGRCRATRPGQAAVVGYVQARTAASDFVFVGNTRHDLIFANDASLYFLLQRPIPVRWNEMHPGIVTSAEVQKEMIAALDRHAVRIVVLADMPMPTEPNQSSQSSNVHLLDDHIKSRYCETFTAAIYHVLTPC